MTRKQQIDLYAYHGLRELQARELWLEFCKSENKPADIPERPDLAYPKEWKGWAHWLGWETLQ